MAMKPLGEVSRKAPTQEISPRNCVPTLPTPENVPPDIAALMAQFAVNQDESKDSSFITDLLALLKLFDVHFEEKPSAYQTEWNLLKGYLQVIKEGVALARDTKNDFPLYLSCLEIQKTLLPFFARWKNWSYLSPLRDLLQAHLKNDLKGLRLQPLIEPEGASLAQKYLELHIHYLLKAREVYNLQNELKASKEYQELQKRITQLSKELATSQGARAQLNARNTELQRRLALSQQTIESQQKTIQANSKRIEDLEAENAKWRSTVQQVREENKTLSDTNEALKLNAHSAERNRPESRGHSASQNHAEKLAATELKLQEKDNENKALRRELASLQYRHSDLQKFHRAARQRRKAVNENQRIVQQCEVMKKILVGESSSAPMPKATP